MPIIDQEKKKGERKSYADIKVEFISDRVRNGKT